MIGPGYSGSGAWRNRNALATTGMWVEVPRNRIVETRDGRALCPLLPGEAFYDEDAAKLRQGDSGVAAVEKAVAKVHAARHKLELELARALQGELRAHPQRRGKVR